MSAIFFAALLYLPQFMTKELGYSAVQAGAGLLPMMATFAATSFVGRAALHERLGAEGGRRRRGRLPRRRDLPAVADRQRSTTTRRSCPAWSCSASASGSSTRRHDGGGHRARRVARQPGRRHRLHVPDRAAASVGLGLNTAIVTASASLVGGIRDAFRLDAVLAFCALLVSLLFVGGPLRAPRTRS